MVTTVAADPARTVGPTSPGGPTPGGTGPAGGAGSAGTPGRRPVAAPSPTPEHARPVRAGQIVATQVAVVLVIATVGRGPLPLTAAALAAVALVLGSWLRVRRRWLFEWLGIGLRYLGRPRVLPAGADPAALLDLVAPDTVVVTADLSGDAAAVLSDGYGLTAVLELGDPSALLSDAPQSLPSPASLLPAAGPDTPPTRIQLVLFASAAPVQSAGAGTAASSYRQLTEGRLLSQERALLAVRVLRTEGWTEADLRRALSGAVRKVRRRLAPVAARPLGERTVPDVLTELAQHDGAQPGQETWPALRLGGLVQTSFRLRRWPDLRAETARRLVPRLLALPTTGTTVSITAGPWPVTGDQTVPVDLTVRLAAVDDAALAAATHALRRLLATEGAVARRLDGEQLDGLAATLPLGVTGIGPTAPGPRPLPTATMETLELPVGSAGLMIGANRHGAPVTARLFRAEATRVMLIGGVRAAQMLALRAMALGARVVVQTARPLAWEPFVRGASTPGESIALIPPGRPVGGAPANWLQPLLVVVDVGPVAADPRPGPAWQAVLVVRDELTTADVDALSRADLVVLQPLRPAEAALAATALGLGASAEWLTRIREDMVGVVNRRSLRWALLGTTPIESQLIGPPARY